jgi:hypothetical protein
VCFFGFGGLLLCWIRAVSVRGDSGQFPASNSRPSPGLSAGSTRGTLRSPPSLAGCIQEKSSSSPSVVTVSTALTIIPSFSALITALLVLIGAPSALRADVRDRAGVLVCDFPANPAAHRATELHVNHGSTGTMSSVQRYGSISSNSFMASPLLIVSSFPSPLRSACRLPTRTQPLVSSL